jgi:hypothetical protein
MNFLDAIMLAYGLDDSVRFHEPEVYYRPKLLAEYAGKSIYDPNWISPLNHHITGGEIQKYLDGVHASVDMQFRPGLRSRPLPSCSKYVTDNSVEEFCDILHSCEKIYCFASGTAALAAALGKRATVFYHRGINPVFIFSRLHEYVYIA